MTTRSGKILGYRVVVDGCPYQMVSHYALATARPMALTTVAAVGSRLPGLLAMGTDGLKFSAKVDVVACKLDVGALTLKLVDFGGSWSRCFNALPTATTWLAATTADTDATVTVLSTSQFPSSGYFWIEQECIQYSSKTGTTFTGCTRGVLTTDAGLAAQWHYKILGSASAPTITNWPIVWEGRSVVVYEYWDSDDPSGAGTQVYRGQVSIAPSFDGKTWTLGVDPITARFDQRFGGDLSDPVKARGVHAFGWSMLWRECTYPDGTSETASGTVFLNAYYDSQAAFCDRTGASGLTQALQASMTAASAQGVATAYDDGEGPEGWHVQYVPGGTVRYFFVCFPTAGGNDNGIEMPLGTSGLGATSATVAIGAWGGMQNTDGTPTTSASPGQQYFLQRNGPSNADAGLGAIPRGRFNPRSSDLALRTVNVNAPLPSSPAPQAFLFDGGQDRGSYSGQVDSASGAEFVVAYNLLGSGRGPTGTGTVGADGMFSWIATTSAPFRLGLSTDLTRPGGANVIDLLGMILLNAPAYATLGLLPNLRLADVDVTDPRWNAFVSMPPLISKRRFTTFGNHSVMDVIRGELLACGYTIGLSATGGLIPIPVRITAATALAALTVARDELLTDKALTTREFSGMGLVSEIGYHDGYDAAKDAFDGDTFTIRSVAAYSLSPSVRALQIQQFSEYVGATPINVNDVLASVTPLLDSLSGDYFIDTIDVVRSDVNMGDVIQYTVPSSIAGTIGNLAVGETVVGMVLGKEWSAGSPRITLTVLGSRTPFAGYAPSFLISIHTFVSGTTWTLVGPDARFFSVNDGVRVEQYDSTSPTIVNGLVSSLSPFQVTLGGAWTPGTSQWFLNTRTYNAGTVTPKQQRYMFMGQLSDGSLKEFAP